MGNGAVKERFEKGSKSKVLTLASLDLSNWEKLMCRFDEHASGDFRSVNLSSNAFSGPLAMQILSPSLFRALRLLDLSCNTIDSIVSFSPLCAILLSQTKSEPEKEEKFKALQQSVLALPEEEVQQMVVGRAYPTFPLETLVLSHNRITAIPPMVCASFPQLKSLSLAHNQIAVCHDAAFVGGAQELVTLDLSFNQLRSWTFGRPTPKNETDRRFLKLEALNLSNNCVASLHVGYRLASLRVVDLREQRDCALKHLSADVYAHCPKLASVNCDGNAMKEQIFEELKSQEAYRVWENRHTALVNKQLVGGAELHLAE